MFKKLLKIAGKIAGVAILGVAPEILNQVGANVPDKYRGTFAIGASVIALFIRRPQDKKPPEKLI